MIAQVQHIILNTLESLRNYYKKQLNFLAITEKTNYQVLWIVLKIALVWKTSNKKSTVLLCYLSVLSWNMISYYTKYFPLIYLEDSTFLSEIHNLHPYPPS